MPRRSKKKGKGPKVSPQVRRLQMNAVNEANRVQRQLFPVIPPPQLPPRPQQPLEVGVHPMRLVLHSDDMQAAGVDFDSRMQALASSNTSACNECQRRSPTVVFSNVHHNMCNVCSLADRQGSFGPRGDIFPCPVPSQLQGLSLVEQMLIAQQHPIVTAVNLALTADGSGYTYSLTHFATHLHAHSVSALPLSIERLASVLLLLTSSASCHLAPLELIESIDTPLPFELSARREVVQQALEYLVDNNLYYRDMVISRENLAAIPQDGNLLPAVGRLQHLQQQEQGMPGAFEDSLFSLRSEPLSVSSDGSATVTAADSLTASAGNSASPFSQRTEPLSVSSAGSSTITATGSMPSGALSPLAPAFPASSTLSGNTGTPPPSLQPTPPVLRRPFSRLSGSPTFVPLVQPLTAQSTLLRLLRLPFAPQGNLSRVPYSDPFRAMREREGFFTRSFPWLLPTGHGALRGPRLVETSLAEYFSYLMRFHDRRFVRDSRFPFLVFNATMRAQADYLVGIAIRQTTASEIATVGHLRQLLAAGTPGESIMSRIRAYIAKLRSTSPYWKLRAAELKDMVSQLPHRPTIYFTLTAADLHWPDLYAFLLTHLTADEAEQLRANGGIDALTDADRQKLLCDNADLVAYYVERRMYLFIRHVIVPIFGVRDFWWRFEWQGRGSGHVHGILWLEGAPAELDLLIDELGEDAIETIRLYFDHLVVAINPPVVGERITPENHPIRRRRYTDLAAMTPEERLQDLKQLLCLFQRHTRCSSYCLRPAGVGQPAVCRFGFPQQVREQSVVVREQDRLVFYPRRNDIRMCRFNAFVTQVFRANTDWTALPDPLAVAAYVSKQASRFGGRDELQQQATIDQYLANLDGTLPVTELISATLTRTLGESDYCRQEVMHFYYGFPFFHSSRNFVNLCLDDNTGWRTFLPPETTRGDGEDEDALQQPLRQAFTVIDRYRSRPVPSSAGAQRAGNSVSSHPVENLEGNDDIDHEGNEEDHTEESVPPRRGRGRLPSQARRQPTDYGPEFAQMSLLEFAQNFTVNGNRYIKRRKPAIVRLHPHCEQSGNRIEDEQYYRQQVILRVPFQGDTLYESLLTDENQVLHENWESRYNALLLGEAASVAPAQVLPRLSQLPSSPPPPDSFVYLDNGATASVAAVDAVVVVVVPAETPPPPTESLPSPFPVNQDAAAVSAISAGVAIEGQEILADPFLPRAEVDLFPGLPDISFGTSTSFRATVFADPYSDANNNTTTHNFTSPSPWQVLRSETSATATALPSPSGSTLPSTSSDRVGHPPVVPSLLVGQEPLLGERPIDLEHQWPVAALGDSTVENNRLFPQSAKAAADFLNEITDASTRAGQTISRNFFAPRVCWSVEQLQMLELLEEQLAYSVLPPRQQQSSPVVLRTVVQGRAGSGKSTLIREIVSRIVAKFGNGSLIVAAVAGKAAINVNGQTVHSAFSIPANNAPKVEPLQNNAQQVFRDKMAQVRFILIDEMSMLGQLLLSKVDARCREAATLVGGHYQPHSPFGGLFVWLFGDFGQLPPVLDTPLYNSQPNIPLASSSFSPSFPSSSSRSGRRFGSGRTAVARRNAPSSTQTSTMAPFAFFQRFCQLCECHRQRDDEPFRQLLDHLYSGTVTRQEYNWLMERRSEVLSREQVASFANAMHLFSTNKRVNEFNYEHLSSNELLPVARIVASDTMVIGPKRRHVMTLDEDEQGLERVLLLQEGCRVMLRANIAIPFGLASGSLGTVRQIVYSPGQRPPALPAYVVVDFDGYQSNGPMANFGYGRNAIPILPITRTWSVNGVSYKRVQLPLMLAHACTIHKAQGLTLNRVVIDLGSRDHTPCLPYVALSRVRRLEDLMLQEAVSLERLNHHATLPSFVERNQFMQRYFAPATASSLSLNRDAPRITASRSASSSFAP